MSTTNQYSGNGSSPRKHPSTGGFNISAWSIDHPYVVIKTPDASVFPDQEFKAQR